MQKIPSLFMRNHDGDKLVRDEVVPGSEWVINGEGMATIKWDGTCCLVRDGKLYKRHEIKRGGKCPSNFEPASEIDEATGKQQGWIPVGDGPEDRWHREAVSVLMPPDGTYELCGPKIQGNPEGLDSHGLLPHGSATYPAFPRAFSEIKALFETMELSIEGIVWHHPDGRMVKIKVKDFGIKRK